MLFGASILPTEEGAYKQEMCEDKEEPGGDGLEWEVVVFRISKICTCICICVYICIYMHVYAQVYITIYISWFCQQKG